MPFASWRNSALIGLFLSGVAAGAAGGPVWKVAVMKIGQERWGELTYKCDHAMREHMIATQALASTPSQENVDVLEAAEVALVDCQDYDLYRKRLIRWGLDDNDLSEMALVAIEERAGTLQELVRTHEIRY